MRIVDPHQHFWDLSANYLPWLTDRPVAFRYGDYSSLKRNYLPGDYEADAGVFEIAGSVYVEAEWDPSDPLGEVDWVTKLQAAFGRPTVMVAQAWLDRDDVERVLAAEGGAEIVRGIRHKPRAAPRPDAVEVGAPGSMGDPAWRRGYSLLSRHGLSFDLQTPWWHLAEAVDLANAFPETPIILNHTGLPADRSEAGLAGWRAAMKHLATVPTAVVKISGLGQPGVGWTADGNRGIVMDTLEIFGVERCMFASNFPVDGLVGSFETIFRGFLGITEDLNESERRAVFHDNAARIYRMKLEDNTGAR